MPKEEECPKTERGFPAGSAVKNIPAMLDWGHRFDSCVGKTPWRQAWQPTQYSCLENPTDRGAWQTTVPGLTKSWT